MFIFLYREIEKRKLSTYLDSGPQYTYIMITANMHKKLRSVNNFTL